MISSPALLPGSLWPFPLGVGQPGLASLSGARLLLGHAVNCPEAEHHIATGNSNDFAVWKKAR